MPCPDIEKVKVLETEDEFNHLIDQLKNQSVFALDLEHSSEDHFLA